MAVTNWRYYHASRYAFRCSREIITLLFSFNAPLKYLARDIWSTATRVYRDVANVARINIREIPLKSGRTKCRSVDIG